MKFRTRKRVLLSIVIAAALGGAVVTEAVAQPDRSERSGKNAKAEVLYPEATRKAPVAFTQATMDAGITNSAQ